VIAVATIYSFITLSATIVISVVVMIAMTATSIIEKFKHIFTSLLAIAYFIVCKNIFVGDEKRFLLKFYFLF
jgi:hypothetical protein